jgi:tripartite-type tricarboxylate transporter receptor subunit TctC
MVTSTKLVHIPYRGAGPAMQDVIAGNVPSMLDFAALGRAAHQGGQGARAGGERRRAQSGLPDVPTMKAQGYPDLVSYSWFGLSARPGCRRRSSSGWRARCRSS